MCIVYRHKPQYNIMTTTQTQYFTDFNTTMLLEGDNTQLNNWLYGTGNKSIYIQTLPQDLGEDTLRDVFQYFGEIFRVDIVKKKEGTMNMAFVHFRYWYSNPLIEYHLKNITCSYPKSYDLPLMGLSIQYLKCRVNTNPIRPDLEYNNVQLTDMADRIRRDHEALKSENEELKKRIFNLELIMKIRTNV